jgi:hypothetical protein
MDLCIFARQCGTVAPSHMPRLYRAATAAIVAASTTPPAYKSVLSVPLVLVLIHFAIETLHLATEIIATVAGQFRRWVASFVGHGPALVSFSRLGLLEGWAGAVPGRESADT